MDPFEGIPPEVLSLGIRLAHKAAREASPAETNADPTALDFSDASVLRDRLAEIASLLKDYEADFEMFNETAAMSAIAFVADDGSICIDSEAVAAILEGFKREIEEGSKGLRLRHRGEIEPQKVSAQERRIAFNGIEFFVSLCELADVGHDYLEPAKVVIAKLGTSDAAGNPNKPVGNPDKDPRRFVLRNAIIAACLDTLKDGGLVPSKYVGLMAKESGLSKDQIWRAWGNAVNRRGKKSRNRIKRCAYCDKPAGEDARCVQASNSSSEEDWDLVCRKCLP